jgi:hypothetical protein
MTIMQGEYENADVDEFTLKVKKVMDPKEIVLVLVKYLRQVDP